MIQKRHLDCRDLVKFKYPDVWDKYLMQERDEDNTYLGKLRRWLFRPSPQ